MQDKVDEARALVLDRIIEWAGLKRTESAPGHLRNLAAVYDILTEKMLAERRVSQYLGADGTMYYTDALGRAIDPAAALAALRGDKP